LEGNMTAFEDVYTIAREIAANLRSDGTGSWATRLDEAIDAGSTGTEIFMALRWTLQQFLQCGETCQPETRCLIDNLLMRLNSQLN
jgi:hypothetical protein